MGNCQGNLCCTPANTDEDIRKTQKLEAPDDFEGPTSNRHCTDIFFALLLIITWGLMTWLGYYVISEGDYRLLTNPIDFEGNVCGLDNTERGGLNMTGYDYMYPVNFYGGGVCVEECPTVPDDFIDPFTLVSYGGVYDSLAASNSTDPTISNKINLADYSESNNTKICTEDTCYPTTYGFPNPVESWSSEGVNEGYGYAFYLVDTKSYFKHCFLSTGALSQLKNMTVSAMDDTPPADETEMGNLSVFKDKNNILVNLYSDIFAARNYIFGLGFCLALVVGFVYLSVLRIPLVLPFITWSSILSTIGALGYLGYYAYEEHKRWVMEQPPTHTVNEILGLQIFSYTLWALGGIMFLLVCFMRQRIVLAIGLVKESSKAVHRLSLLTLFPALQSVAIILFCLIWMVYAVYLASMGEFQPVEVSFHNTTVTFRSFEYDTQIEQAGWFLLFCFFWTTQFVIALGELLVALSIAKWFFSRERKTMGNKVVLQSFGQTMLYHMGTAAFGSLVIAIISMIRAVVTYVESKVQGSGNRLAAVALKCLQCFLWCVDKAVKFLNKNAYIQCAIHSTNLCVSAQEAFYLILRNVGRIGTLTVICEILVFIGKIFIAVISAGASYLVLDQFSGLDLYSPIGPVMVIAVIAYFVGCTFMGVFSMAVSTMLQCFVADEEMFGSSDSSFAPKSLRAWITVHQKKPGFVPRESQIARVKPEDLE